MSRIILKTTGGTVSLPDPLTIMIDRRDGGQLVVHPSRRVWDRTALDAAEHAAWNALVSATARAMLETLPQLDGGCLNYWDAGNWALNDAASPVGPKRGPAHRVLHLHLVGRSPGSTDPDWSWGESPRYPWFADRFAWSVGKQPLTSAECLAIAARAGEVLVQAYGVATADITPWAACASCGYPTPGLAPGTRCASCAEQPTT